MAQHHTIPTTTRHGDDDATQEVQRVRAEADGRLRREVDGAVREARLAHERRAEELSQVPGRGGSQGCRDHVCSSVSPPLRHLWPLRLLARDVMRRRAAAGACVQGKANSHPLCVWAMPPALCVQCSIVKLDALYALSLKAGVGPGQPWTSLVQCNPPVLGRTMHTHPHETSGTRNVYACMHACNTTHACMHHRFPCLTRRTARR